MTVQIANTELNSSFNTWRLNTNFISTVMSNNVVTVSRDGSANRGGVAKGNGHIAGTFTANELRTTALKAGNTSNDGAWLYVNSNTSVNTASLTVTANTTFQGNVVVATSGTNRFIMGDISRVRVTGGSQGHFLRIEGESDTPNFKPLTLRDITDLSSNSADIILSGANSSFSDNSDSPALVLTNGADRAKLYMGSDPFIGDSDVILNLVDASGDSKFIVADSANTEVASIDSAGNIIASNAFLPSADDSVDLGSSGAEFKDAYIDGVAYIDELSMGTAAGQGVATSLIPKTDAVGNLGSTTRKWGTVWADTTNGGVGIFKTLGLSGNMNANGKITVADMSITEVSSNILPNDDDGVGQYSIGSTSRRWHNVYANNVFANNITTDNDLTVTGDLAVLGATTIASGQAFQADTGTFTTLNVLGATTLDGSVDLGDTSGDLISVIGTIDTDLIPSGSRNIGSSGSQWNNGYFTGTLSTDELSVDENVTITGSLTANGNVDFNGDSVDISGNTSIGGDATVNGLLDVGNSIDVTNEITNDGTVMFGANARLHANNTISDFSILTSMLANTMASSASVGSATEIPVFTVNNRGQITGISETLVAGVSGFSYTQSNNDLEISTATGTSFNATIDPATTTSGTGRGVASFDSGDFSVTSGHVTLSDSASGAVIGINGTSNEIEVSRTNGTVTVGLPTDVAVAGELTVGENVIISGNLIVQGTTTTVESETVRIADNIIVLNSNEAGTPSQNGGITIERGTSTNVSLVWNETTDQWEIDGQTYSGRIVTTGDTASGGALIPRGLDQRGEISQIGLDTDDYYSITATQHRWFLDGAEDMRLTNNGQLDVEGSVVAHSSTVSDKNLKENLEVVTGAISKVQKLNGYTFNYKKDGRAGAGIVAQEVEEVLPSAVQRTEILGHEGEHLIVEYDQLTALLIESIKELKAEIDELKKHK